MTDLPERVAELRRWAKSRIEHCRELEVKFGRSAPRHGPPQTLVDAWTERRALQAVLAMLEKDRACVCECYGNEQRFRDRQIWNAAIRAAAEWLADRDYRNPSILMPRTLLKPEPKE